MTAVTMMAMGLKEGARKYGPFNWRVEPVQGRIYLEAALRHLLLLLDGEDFDRDTGIHHSAFVLSTMAIFIDTLLQGRQIDNRPLPGRTGDLVAFFNDTPGTEARSKEALITGFKQLIPNNLLGTPLAPTPQRSAKALRARKGSTTKNAAAKRTAKLQSQVRKVARNARR